MLWGTIVTEWLTNECEVTFASVSRLLILFGVFRKQQHSVPWLFRSKSGACGQHMLDVTVRTHPDTGLTWTVVSGQILRIIALAPLACAPLVFVFVVQDPWIRRLVARAGMMRCSFHFVILSIFVLLVFVFFSGFAHHVVAVTLVTQPRSNGAAAMISCFVFAFAAHVTCEFVGPALFFVDVPKAAARVTLCMPRGSSAMVGWWIRLLSPEFVLECIVMLHFIFYPLVSDVWVGIVKFLER